ncbi:MAG: helix-turn-helix transcriptional regulator [Clostridia bacterium]|nr:helix-turn-helix transcriptional regulator [Clostridia bacterium]
MTDKKTFGSFIKNKRTEKNYSQKDLAEMLFVIEGAVSKWERGVSYPDITLISDICRVLDISEHELITASTDTDTRKMKHEARKFRVIRGIWFWVPTISYAVALLTCFICNLAVNHTLSWFFIVLTALLCAYAFIPTFTSFFERKKLLVFTVTSYLSICLLLFTCSVYTNGLYWFPVACIGTLMGYILVFGTILLSRTKLSHFKFVIAFTAVLVLTILLLLCIYSWHHFMIKSAILITIYAYIPLIFCAVICMFAFNWFLKAGICTIVASCVYYCMGHVTNALFGLNENHYEVDFHNWAQCVTGNVHLIVITTMLFTSALLFVIGFLRVRKTRNDK